MGRTPLFNEAVRSNIPQTIEGEPPFLAVPFGSLKMIKSIVVLILFASVVWPLSCLVFPLFVVGVVVYGYPPHIPNLREGVRLVKAIWATKYGIKTYQRIWLTFQVLHKLAWIPLSSCFWFLDEILYGNEFKKTEIINPLFEISATRSGSTQMARYLEKDESLTGPNLLQVLCPYMWMWKVMNNTAMRFVTKDWVEEKMVSNIPKMILERHELSVFGIETFEVWWIGCHLREIAFHLGGEVHSDFYSFSEIPTMKDEWNLVFPAYIESIARKHLAWMGEEGKGKRIFIKGHFMGGAEGMRKRFPDADFFTVLRPPHLVLQSFTNFLQTFDMDPIMGRPSWREMVKFEMDEVIRYSRQEKEWYQKEDGANKFVVRFNEYVKDLEGTMKFIYQNGMGGKEVPDYIPKEHTKRERKKYSMNRSLDDLGVNVEGMREELADYYDWMENKQ